MTEIQFGARHLEGWKASALVILILAVFIIVPFLTGVSVGISLGFNFAGDIQ
jgi:hypothetical protein